MAKRKYAPGTAREDDYCGICYIGGGSTWAYAATPAQAAVKAAKQCVQDWKSLFKFEKGQYLGVCIYDMKKHEGWYSEGPHHVYDHKTKEHIPILEIIKVAI